MYFALSLIFAFTFLGLFIYKGELFHASKDSSYQSDYQSEDMELHNDDAYSNSGIIKNNQSLGVNLEVNESNELAQWKLKQQLNTLGYLSHMELMYKKNDKTNKDNTNHSMLKMQVLRKWMVELSVDLKKI